MRYDIWNTDPLRWNKMCLLEKISNLRKFYCTGPCGQSSTVMKNRAVLEEVLNELSTLIAKLMINNDKQNSNHY